jgi:hypothetical protein
VDKKIQAQFGEAVIQELADFARQDVVSTANFEQNEFSFVSDANLRRALATTMYGARWLYKLGLALLVTGDERVAHVRTQIIDYGSISESLLCWAIARGVVGNYLNGTAWRQSGATTGGNPLSWNAANADRQARKRSFWWLIEVSKEEAIVNPLLAGDLQRLRKYRNTVHVTELAARNITYAIAEAKRAYTTCYKTVQAVRTWAATHP